MKDVLVINSYGGSLLLGTKAGGYPIRGSYEDSGFGMEAQKLNFPDLKFVEKLPWPEENDLIETVVIAHPPCAPFSIMNPMKGQTKYEGTGADGFQCHRQVMEYSLSRGCPALAVESVPGVLKAAAEYEAYAQRFGYGVYFLKVNSISFGVPQWRPRVWVIFVKGPAGKFGVNFTPNYQKLSSILVEEGTLIDALWDKRGWSGRGHTTSGLVRRLTAAVDPNLLREIFEGDHGIGTILQIGAKVLNLDDPGVNFSEVRKAWNLGGLFSAMVPRILSPESWAPTVLGGSAWFINGRPLFLEEYNQIMGFPANYKWPESYSDPRLYLSKGVCPPVATWILQSIEANLQLPLETVFQHYCDPGSVLDLCPKKADVEDALVGRVKEVRPAKVGKTRTPNQPAAPAQRTRVTTSDLAQQFLASLKGEQIT